MKYFYTWKAATYNATDFSACSPRFYFVYFLFSSGAALYISGHMFALLNQFKPTRKPAPLRGITENAIIFFYQYDSIINSYLSNLITPRSPRCLIGNLYYLLPCLLSCMSADSILMSLAAFMQPMTLVSSDKWMEDLKKNFFLHTPTKTASGHPPQRCAPFLGASLPVGDSKTSTPKTN